MPAKIHAFVADGLKISGPNKIGGFTVSFFSGSYAAEQISALLTLPAMKVLKVTVELDEEINAKITQKTKTGEVSHG